MFLPHVPTVTRALRLRRTKAKDSSTTIGDAGLVALAPALRRLPALESLILWGNPFGNEGLVALVAPPPPADAPPPTTRGLTKLSKLDLDYTQVSNAGCAALASALESGALPALEDVGLEGIPASAIAIGLVRPCQRHGASGRYGAVLPPAS